MSKFIIVVIILLFTVLQLTNCSPVKRDWVNEVKKEPIILNDTNPEYRGGPDIVEGDIKLTPVQAAIFKESGWDGLVKSEAWMRNHGVWPRHIPYYIDRNPRLGRPITRNIENELRNSINEIEKFTCVRFIPYQRHNVDYIHIFADGNNCYSPIGRTVWGGQRLSLGPGCDKLIPAHELMHALGRYHEQSRPDRDNYVQIIRQNIDQTNPNTIRNFDFLRNSLTLNIPYDYFSLMHYEKNGFGLRRPDGTQMTTVQANGGALIGQREAMSLYDILHINIEYCPENTLRLVDSRQSGIHEGRVEVFWNQQWGTVCGDGFTNQHGQVMCRYMGFPGLQTVDRNTGTSGRYKRRGYGPTWIYRMSCTGSELNPFHCNLTTPIGKKLCPHDEDIGLRCQKNVRLIGGTNSSEGRVEVYLNGEWGTVCSTNFDQSDAKVICRQLGLNYKQAQALPNARFGGGTLPILMSHLECDGSEQQVSHCMKRSKRDRKNCNHSMDASVRCI